MRLACIALQSSSLCPARPSESRGFVPSGTGIQEESLTKPTNFPDHRFGDVIPFPTEIETESDPAFLAGVTFERAAFAPVPFTSFGLRTNSENGAGVAIQSGNGKLKATRSGSRFKWGTSRAQATKFSRGLCVRALIASSADGNAFSPRVGVTQCIADLSRCHLGYCRFPSAISCEAGATVTGGSALLG